jgi:RNA polymerase sigma-70 factor (ECF subfamily)
LNPTPHDVSKLLAEHGGQLYALLFRLTLRPDVADDLLQDLFCKLARSDGFQAAKNPLGYAYQSATNLAFDWRRAKKHHPTTGADDSVLQTSVPSPLADLICREELEQTLTAIGNLPPANRDIVVLRYLQNQSYETIADQFGKTAHQVRAIAHKAITQLRDKLEAEPKQRFTMERPIQKDLESNAEGVEDQSPGSAAQPRHPG